MSDWIPVSERLPKKGVQVTIMMQSDVMNSWDFPDVCLEDATINAAGQWDYEVDLAPRHITHWRAKGAA